MNRLLIVLAALAFALPISAWERLLTKSGAEIEGDVRQEEFLFEDPSGGEIVIPRAAIARFENDGDRMNATLKDGTTVSGSLEGKIEIEDGLIRRRYDGSEIERIDFDNYISVERGETYHSCPIRIGLSARTALLDERSVGSTALTGSVTCNDLKIVNVAFTRNGSLARGKDATLTARFTVAVPEGPDQLAELSLDVVQGGEIVASAKKRLVIGEGELSVVPLKLSVPAAKLSATGPEPTFRIQLVTQDEDEEVERGGFFWWFTVAIPI